MSYLALGIGTSFRTAAATGPMILALGASMLAGMVSFASPCCVPLVPRIPLLPGRSLRRGSACGNRGGVR